MSIYETIDDNACVTMRVVTGNGRERIDSSLPIGDPNLHLMLHAATTRTQFGKWMDTVASQSSPGAIPVDSVVYTDTSEACVLSASNGASAINITAMCPFEFPTSMA